MTGLVARALGWSAPLADVRLADSYAQQRERLLVATLPSAAAAVFAITLFYAVGELLHSPARFRASWGLYLVQLTTPLLALFLLRGSRRLNVQWVVLAADLVFTAALVCNLLLAAEPTSGVALVLCLKMVGTAVLFPWDARFQYASASVTVPLYWGLLIVSGRMNQAVGTLDDVFGPVAAALLSAAGAFGLDRTRRALFSDMTERQRAEEKTEVLLQVANDISGTLDLDDLLSRVQRRTAQLLPCDTVVTFNWDETQAVFRMISQYGVEADLLAEVEALEFPAGAFFGGRLTKGETVVINDASQPQAALADLFGRFGIAAMVVAPMRGRSGRLGALVAVRRQAGRPFERGQVEVCTGIARQLAVAIEAVELYRAQQQESQIAAALARVGQELISSERTPALLERLCRVTAEVLGCDYSHTWICDPRELVYTVAAAYGESPEDLEALRVLKVSRTFFAPLVQQLERDGIINSKISQLPSSEVAAYAREHGITALLIMPLHRDGKMLGLLSAGYRGRSDAFNPRQERIARGIAQLGSLALENARLIEELERATRLKSDFVATMSHELRTPLNAIIGYVDLMLEGVFGRLPPEQVDTLQKVQKSSSELLDLVNATLDLSRLEVGRIALEIEDVRLEDLLSALDAETRQLQERSGLSFAWKVPQGLHVRTDSTKLKLVVKNLIGNAVKFTERGSVTIEACLGNGGIEIAVSDTGIGIAPEALPIIFEPFRQGDSSRTRQYGGVGLGLYIVRSVLSVLGGTIQVESARERGSTFRVWLPARTPANGDDPRPFEQADPPRQAGSARG
jgi:signal transduction histidine kinase